MKKHTLNKKISFNWAWLFVVALIGVVFILLSDLQILNLHIFSVFNESQSPIYLIQNQNQDGSIFPIPNKRTLNTPKQHLHDNDLTNIINENQCQWYYDKDYMHPSFHITHKDKEDIYPLHSAYNYSIPIHTTLSTQELYSHIVPNTRFNRHSLPITCTYNGKIFNIGIQKTGTTSIANALQYLNYQCNSYDMIEIPKTCANHQLKMGYKNHLRFHRSWRPFSADDISEAFANTNYTKNCIY